VQYSEPTVSLNVDETKWPRMLENVTALYRRDPKLQSFTAVFRGTATNRYFLNSEGSQTRTGRTIYMYNIEGSTQAADGMRLDRSMGHTIATAAELPSEETMKQQAEKVIETLGALRDAPIVEEQWRGPLLASADASTDIFDQLVAQNLAGKHPRPGETSRTTGAFANEYKSRVLPEDVTLVDDPTQTEAAGRKLVGNYNVDDEAVKAAPITVIDKGVLVNYLMSRTPIRDFPASNGHGRASSFGAATAMPGNIFVKVSDPLSPAKLREKFLAMCKDRGLKYCYRVETLGRGLSPRMLYRVYVADGHEELVRGARFDQLDGRAMRSDIIALGDDLQTANNFGQVTYSIVAPSLLFDEVEVKRTPAGKEKLPQYPAPDIGTK